MCGEHQDGRRDEDRHLGSSPHVRGTLIHQQDFREELRIIPACAGNTLSVHVIGRPDRDHPRMCGEHFSSLTYWWISPGSSPHVRGTRPYGYQLAGKPGIIPACAGNTRAYVFGEGFDWDHPRMCGEHRLFVLAQIVELGSSPHVRGTPGVSFGWCEGW